MFFSDCAVAIAGRGSLLRDFRWIGRLRSSVKSKDFGIISSGCRGLLILSIAIFTCLAAPGARAEKSSAASSASPALISAPVPAGTNATAAAGARGAANAGAAAIAAADPAGGTGTRRPTGALYGTILDSNGAELSGAHVTLSGAATRTQLSNSNGEFTFSALPAGTYSIKVTGKGMSPASVPDIVLRPGGVRFLSPVVLAVATATTNVQVFANPEALAQEQLDLQLHQRVLGFLPNYYSSYDWNAEHLWPKQKFELGYRSEIDPVAFVIIGAEAGIEQGYDRFPGFGQGAQGYAKRYAAAYATDFTGTMISDFALPSLFHQDPRYFYKGTGSFGSRALYAVSRALICRGDNKKPEFDYSRILGDFAAGAISNYYYPPEDRGVSLVFTNGAIDIAANASTNLIREFVLPGLTSHMSRKVKIKNPFHL